MNLHVSIPNLNVIFFNHLPLVGLIFCSLWGPFLANKILRGHLNRLGLYPRRLSGLPGILFSPFLHANFSHLVFNSLPLFILVNFILFEGQAVFLEVSFIIISLSGLATWLVGRRAYHIGASGVIMGYFSYLLMNAYQQPTVLSIALAAVCLYYFMGLFAYLIPNDEKLSWEAHIFGFLAGIAANYGVVHHIKFFY